MQIPDSKKYQTALWLLSKGFSVIPVSKEKKAIIEWKEFQERHPTEEEVSRWWTRTPDANVAIVTGAISNLLAIDVDTQTGS